MRKIFILIQSALFIGLIATAQSRSPELFSVGGKSISADEFLRMYTKNLNNKKPDFSKKALQDYLDLYSLFKMKVAEAEDLALDTLPSIRQEFGQYQKQLANNYLTNKDVTDQLVKEAYERMKKDVRVSHILISVSPGSSDTVAQYQKIDSLYKEISSGRLDFGNAAKLFSYDKASAANFGDIGFFTAMQVVYPFENVAYETPVGKLSKPFRTPYGFHILKKTGERPARGQIQVAQIMMRVKESEGPAGVEAAKKKIDDVYALLKSGKKFNDLVKQYNEDEFSKNTDGVLPYFGVGRMVENYEDAAFALKKPGDFSEPVRTKNGFHIISLLNKKALEPFDSLKSGLEKQIQRDGRIKVAQDKFLDEIKTKVNYKPNVTAYNELVQAIPDSVLQKGGFDPLSYKKMTKNIFTMNHLSMTQSDFANYIQEYTRGKMYGPKESSLKALYDNLIQKICMDYEEKQLEQTNPEYKNLLQEYREGILIFELTDQNVWGKAPKDSIGLKNYYEGHKVNYQWKPAISGVLYKAKDEDNMKKLLTILNGTKKMTVGEIVKAVNGDGAQDKLSAEEGKFEQNRFSFKAPFVAGKYMPYYKNADGSYSLLDVKEVYNNATQKTFDEAKGFVISEYQDELEKQWHSQLKAKYPIQLNQKVFESLVNKK